MSGDSTREIDTMPRGLLAVGRSVVLVGLMGAGKTSVGRRLAKALDESFRDADEEIVAAAGMSIPDIFESYGEPGFRDLERRVIARLLDEPPMVLALGGGAFVDGDTRAVIRARGISVWLKADLDLLWQRVRHKTTRPLLRTANPRETLRELYERRQPLYAQADIVVESAAERSVEEMASRVVEALKHRPDVLEV